jgi:ABC-type branched-subunit amino acid transport system substrate-binding protein
MRLTARASAVGAAALVAAGVSGCATASNSSVTVSGKTLVIYASTPPGGIDPAVAQDVLDAETLAFSQGSAQVAGFRLRLVRVSHAKLSDSARAAIENSNSVAYVGELAPGASADSLGITNGEDLLQVAPTDTAAELTQSTPAVSRSPNRYYEALKTYGRTFARVVPSTVLEAKAQLQEMKSLGVRSLYVTSDGSSYGATVATAVRTAAAAAGVTVAQRAAGTDAMFYGGSSSAVAARAISTALSASPQLKVFAPSGLDLVSFAAELPATARNVYVSAPGFLPRGLPASGRQFLTAFKAAYHHMPAPQAIFGYAAMQGVLDALRRAGSGASNRATVVHDFFPITNHASALGTYSINSNGDINLGPFVFNRLHAGKLVPFKSLQVQG